MTAAALIALCAVWFVFACLLLIPVAVFMGIGARHDEQVEQVLHEHADSLGAWPDVLFRSHSED